MDTPICDFVRAYQERNPVRLHMPGHKGVNGLGVEERDITEIPGADVLYSSGGIIRQSEENAAALFGAARTVYSAEGSSLSIRAMLYLTALYARQRGEEPSVLAGRNAHKVFITAAALLDLDVSWIFPEERDYLSCEISPERLDAMLIADKPTAVYVTSPDYLGNVADIAGLAAVCHAHDVLLLVDNAHGAYLQFLPESRHPMLLGADLCCDSAHKTLPVLTGGGYLHISERVPDLFAENAERAMGLFASTSPSYLILQSLDRTNAILAESYRAGLSAFVTALDELKAHLRAAGFTLRGNEPLKVTLAPKSYGYTGRELEAYLMEQNICAEFADPDYLVLMFTPQCPADTLELVGRALLALERRAPIEDRPLGVGPIEQKMSAHDALLAPCREVPVEQSVGRILSSATVSCPPAIPIVACGEVITEEAVKVLGYYGIETICVVEEEA